MLDERIPRLVEAKDVTSLEIDALEGFVHSCIDGVLNIDDLADLTGLDQEAVNRVVERLIGLGAVEWVGKDVSKRKAEASESARSPEQDDDVALSAETRKLVVEFHGRLGELTHYQALGVSPSAERKEIRSAYFLLSKRVHPDAYFGKRLGSYKAKMEAIFKRLTDAYEVLGRNEKRAAYDRYLARNATVYAAEEEIARAEERAEAMVQALIDRPSRSPAPAAVDIEAVESAAPPAHSVQEPRRTPSQQEVQAARARRKRELLERRLRPRAQRGQSQPPRSAPPRPPDLTERVGSRAALRELTSSLKQTAQVTGGVDRVGRHLETAQTAEADGDLAKAVTALRMAMALQPERSELQAEYERVNSLLRIRLVDIHREQAKYEEQNKMWAAASISWAKVADASPEDPRSPARAARALLNAGGDLRKARDYAQRSIALAPDHVETRVLLARIYIEAGMDNSARKELDAAAKLDPRHEMVKNLIKQVGG